ncbi:MAG: methyltransferase domain-containing protein, partial [Vallitaleaceae bacterium]|nr:methyltransferase domain-containing protein [Vallitaleaceae bacterium]
MKIKKMMTMLEDVKPYSKGTATMWTDPYISKQLLDMHINPDTNTASRKEITIDKIIGLICEISDKPFGKVIDLGCGPGLYTEKLAKKGYQLTGVDFSNNSIDYAKKHAKQNQLNIHYICGNYLDIDIEEEGTYDLVMMIYCDFGVLSMEEREKLMKNIYG